MKRLLLFAATLLVVLSIRAHAASLDDPGVPHTINLQSLIFDANGKITQKDRVDIAVKILDADHNVVFEENHDEVLVVKGAVNIEIGSEAGGVPLEILDPSTGTKFVDVMVTGSDPWDLMPLGAVPYSMWAERALTVSDDAIESRHIKNGTIQAEDIDPLAFSDIQGQAAEGQIPATITTDAELNTHILAAIAHPASAITIKGPFANFVAYNVQEAIQKIDIKILDEYANRINGTKELMATDVTILDSEISRSGDTIYGELSFYTDETLITQTLSLSPATGDIEAEGELSMLGGLVTVEKDDNTNEALLLIDDSFGNERIRLSGGDGAITLNGNIVISGLVDGIDVSENAGLLQSQITKEIADRKAEDTTLQGNLDAHANLTTAHGSDGTVVGLTTLTKAVSDHAALTQGVHGLSSIPGNAIVGTTETQTLTNKTLTSPVINGGVISNATISSSSFSGDLADNTVQTNDIQDNAVNTAKIADGTILVSDLNGESFASWDQNLNDDLTTSTSFGGDVSGMHNAIVVADDSHNHGSATISGLGVGDFTSPNVSQWSNDSGYITDGNTGWDNSYGFITDGNQGWDNSYGFITTTDANNTYVNVTGGDTMSGNLTMNNADIAMDPGRTVDGVDVGFRIGDHETRIDNLEKKATQDVAALAGALNAGEQIPLPADYAQNQCVWNVSLQSFTMAALLAPSSYGVAVDGNRVVSCTGNVLSCKISYSIICIK